MNIAVGAGTKIGIGTGRIVFEPLPVSTVSLSSSEYHNKIQQLLLTVTYKQLLKLTQIFTVRRIPYQQQSTEVDPLIIHK